LFPSFIRAGAWESVPPVDESDDIRDTLKFPTKNASRTGKTRDAREPRLAGDYCLRGKVADKADKSSQNSPMYDLIGDIHGHADELVQLLEALGYRKHGGTYAHPDRKVIFLGDFIDRGPKIREVLEIVRPMVEEGKALAVMGNHELNALGFHTEDPERPGEFLRCRCDKNVRQHRKTIEQLNHPGELQSYLEWFRTLPLWLDLDGIRVVHACWDERCQKAIDGALQQHGGVSLPFLQAAFNRADPLFRAVEVVLKGKEAQLPNGIFFSDKEGCVRTEMRTRWYLSPHGHTYASYALQTDPIDCTEPLAEPVLAEAVPYPKTAKPVFVGHYWLSAERPEILTENVACLDYSVAKGGFLCAYRWHGEQQLQNAHFLRASA
jgi:Calcineurin-like phosphoesterase